MAFYVIPLLVGQTDTALDQLKATDKSVKKFECLDVTPTIAVVYDVLLNHILLQWIILKMPEPRPGMFMAFTNPCVFSSNEYTLMGRKVDGIHFLAFVDSMEETMDRLKFSG